MTDPRSPCIIGVAQQTWRAEDGDAPEPLELWERMCREAVCDSGGKDVLSCVDALNIVYSLSWQYDDPPARLAERLALPAGRRHYSGLSGTTPQHLLQKAGEEMLANRCDLAVVVGGEALASKRRWKKQGREPEWSHRPEQPPALPFDDPFHPAEVAHQVFQAYLTFAVFDVARRAHLGLSPEENRRRLGALFAPMTSVAAANPKAWFRSERMGDELVEAGPSNRMVAYPYTKNVISFMDVDMAAAVLIASHAKADALGVPADRRVYLRGWCYAKDPVYVAERADLWRSLAIEEASREALRRAGVGIDDIAYLDLYSCFGSSVNFACDALGLSAGDSRPLTVTGGLPFFGGAGNNYLSHSVVTMIEKLRGEPSAYGMVSGVGMHMTNHVFGIYSAAPGSALPPDEAAAQARVAAVPVRAIRGAATGAATVAAYSVVHDREGLAWGLAVCDLPEGDRCYARVDDADLMRAMESEEWVGRSVELEDAGSQVNRIRG